MRQHVDQCAVRVHDQRHRLELERALHLRERFGDAPLVDEQMRIPLMRGRVARFQVNGVSEFAFARRPIPVVRKFRPALCGMRFGETRINLQRFHRRGLRIR